MIPMPPHPGQYCLDCFYQRKTKAELGVIADNFGVEWSEKLTKPKLIERVKAGFIARYGEDAV